MSRSQTSPGLSKATPSDVRTLLRGKKQASVHMISVPTPILLRGSEPVSPNRTNYFPTPQLMLASALLKRFEIEGIPWSVHFGDFKSLPDMDRWDEKLQDYEEFEYGNQTRLTKCMVGDGLSRIAVELAGADIVCITANFTLEARSVVEAIRLLRELHPSTLILVGGRDAMARPAYFLQMGADIVADGDADYSLPELLVRLYRGEDIGDLVRRGVLYNIAGRIRLDGLPFMRFDLLKFPLRQYCESGGGRFLPSVLQKGGVAYFETSRGCFRECGYCTERLTQRSEMSVQRFKDEIGWFRANGVHTVMLSDDNILQRMNHGERGEAELVEMFTYLRDLEMVWEFPVGVEIGRLLRKGSNEFHERLTELMFWNNDNPDNFAGAFRGLVPFENVLALTDGHSNGINLRKMRSFNENTLIFHRLIEAGIPQINLAVMIGFPQETRESIATTQFNLNALKLMRDEIAATSERQIGTHVNFSVFTATPFPGTPYFEEMRAARRLEYDIEQHPELWNLYTSVVRGDTFSAAESTERRRELLSLGLSHHQNGKVQLHMSKYADTLPVRTGATAFDLPSEHVQ